MPTLAQHVCVGGPSGGGKTTYLRELHAEFAGRSVFLTVKPNERKAKKDPPVRLRQSSAAYPADIQTAREWAQKQREPVQIIVDEAQRAPSFSDSEGADGPVRRGLHEDRDRDIKWVIATQNPQDLRTTENNYGPLQQCRYFVWVGVLKSWHTGFTDWLGVTDQLEDSSNFTVSVIDPSNPPRVVHRTTTKRKYA